MIRKAAYVAVKHCDIGMIEKIRGGDVLFYLIGCDYIEFGYL